MKNRQTFSAVSVFGIAALIAVYGAQSMPDTHEVVATTYYRTFSTTHPILKRVRPGDTVVTKTIDGAGKDENDVERAKFSNPLTGPFYVEGAEPGDALIVRFNKVRLNRNWGFTHYRLGLHTLVPESVIGMYANRYVTWDIDVQRQRVHLREPKSVAVSLDFPAKPMLGCVGVAPSDFSPSSKPAGSYGGNLDYNEIGEGSTVMLPVYHTGAFLFIGDAHALQGDGEPASTGVETSMNVEFTVDIRKKAGLTGPRVETADFIISVGSQPEFVSSLDRGLQLATSDMIRWLVEEYGLEIWAAHLLIGYQAEYEVVTTAGSMALKIQKRLLPVRPKGGS